MLVAAFGSVLYCFGLIRYLPTTAENVICWDAAWFQKIAQEGYVHPTTRAFFPLFPLLWRTIGASPMEICLWNLGLFLAAFTALVHALALPRRWILFALSTPSLFIMAVPYSEALFFCCGTMLVAGLHVRRTAWALIGVFGCGLTRSASTLRCLCRRCCLLPFCCKAPRRRGAAGGGQLEDY